MFLFRGLLDAPAPSLTVRFVRKFWGLLVVFVAGIVVGVGPTILSLLAGADRLGGFTEGDATTEGLDSGLDEGLDKSTDERRDENLVRGVDESLVGGGDARLDGRTLAPGPVRDAHDNRAALPKTSSVATVPRRIDSLDPLRPPPVYVEQVVSFTIFFAPHSSKLDQTALVDASAFVAPAFAGRNVRVFCDGYTQYGSGHGADVRLSTRRAENVCAAIAALGLEAEFTPVGHGQADFQGDAARFVAVRLEFEVRPTPGAASLVPAHG